MLIRVFTPVNVRRDEQMDRFDLISFDIFVAVNYSKAYIPKIIYTSNNLIAYDGSIITNQ